MGLLRYKIVTLRNGSAIGTYFNGVIDQLLFNTCHADFKELIEITRDNTEKADTL